MTITGGSALDKDEIDRMVNDAERYAEEDAQRRELVETRNPADQMVNQTETLLTEQAEQLTDDEKAAIESALGDLRTEIENSEATTESLREKIEATITASQALAQRLYEQASADQAAAGGDAGGDDQVDEDEDIVDAEIVDEGDEA